MPESTDAQGDRDIMRHMRRQHKRREDNLQLIDIAGPSLLLLYGP